MVAVSGLALVMAVIAIVWPTGGAAAARVPELPVAMPSPERGPPRNVSPPLVMDVRPPVAADLAGYTIQLSGSGVLRATIVTTLGTIHCELFEDKAPMTVANFVGLATGRKPWTNPRTGSTEHDRPFYDGLIFHRVIQEFVIQGGDPLGTGSGGPGYTFDDEIVPDLKMAPGTLAMANAGPRTNGSQFFITEGAPAWLDGHHTIFGKCGDLDVVKRIARTDQGNGNRPLAAIRMTVTISR